MLIAIPVTNDAVSTVFDFSESLILVATGAGGRKEYSRIPFREPTIMDKTRRLNQIGVSVILCGAVSRPFGRMMEMSGIRVFSHLRGPVTSVLQAYETGRITDPVFALPGRPAGRGRRGGRGGGRRRGGGPFF